MVGQTCGGNGQATAQEELGEQLATAAWDRLGEGNPGSLQRARALQSPWDQNLHPVLMRGSAVSQGVLMFSEQQRIQAGWFRQ